MIRPGRALRAVTRRVLPRANPELVTATDQNFDEIGYLDANRDVAEAVANGAQSSGFRHFTIFGRSEDRKMYRYRHGRLSRSRYRIAASLWNLADRWSGVAPTREPTAREMATRIYDLEVQLAQISDLMEIVHGFGPPPPKHLQVRVVGNFSAGFVTSGVTTVSRLVPRALEQSRRSIKDFQSILDFGCGCGRTIFALAGAVAADATVHGTDIDPEAIGWLNDHHPTLARFAVCPTVPPMAYPDESFDLIFGVSVFTHLPEDLQFKWLAELARVLRPDGYCVLTTHGAHHYKNVDKSLRAVIEREGFLYQSTGYGRSISLPDFYETAYHTHNYIKNEWARFFEVVDIREPEPGEHQDLVLLRRMAP